jgi:hypothetical protein
MVPKHIALKALEVMAAQARLMVEYMAISSTNPKDKEIAFGQIDNSKTAMSLILDGAESV